MQVYLAGRSAVSEGLEKSSIVNPVAIQEAQRDCKVNMAVCYESVSQ